MSAGLLHLHNFLRWVVLIAGLIAIVRAFMGMNGSKPYNKLPGTIFLASLHTQVLLGLGIYFGISGVVATFLADPGASMKVSMLRFYGVEHLLGMLVAAVLVTIGSARARRAPNDAAKNKAAAVFFSLGMLIIFVSIPWPFRGDGVGRGLFPGMKAPAATTTTETVPEQAPPQPNIGKHGNVLPPGAVG